MAVAWTDDDLAAIKAQIQALMLKKASLSTDAQAVTERSIRELQDHYDWVAQRVAASSSVNAGVERVNVTLLRGGQRGGRRCL
jgi:hypothetical protein